MKKQKRIVRSFPWEGQRIYCYGDTVKKAEEERDKRRKELEDAMPIPSLQDTAKSDITMLDRLLKKLEAKAKKGDEDAITAVLKAMQVRQKMIAEYHAREPKKETGVEKYRKKSEELRRKNAAIHKP